MKNKNILLISGTGTLGRFVLSNLYSKGCNVVYSYRSKKKINEIKIKSKKNVLLGFKCDLHKESEIKSLINSAYKKLKRIDYVIDCSGIFYYDKIKQLNYKSLTSMFQINAFATVVINKYINVNKKKSDWVKIITCGSSSAVIGARDTVSYCGSKHALLGIVKSLNQTLYKKKIINYCLNFGTLDSKMSKQIRNTKNQNLINQMEVVKSIFYLIEIGNNGLPEELYLKRFN
tara:strand:- start:458 stop:1150 length:693 start_codon:yes stop_codon:yes gene_type:complete